MIVRATALAAFVALLVASAPARAYDYEDDYTGGTDWAGIGWRGAVHIGAGLPVGNDGAGSAEFIRSLRLGYRSYTYFSNEVQVENFQGLDVFAATFNGKVLYGTRRWQPYVSYGFGVGHDGSSTDMLFRAGGGLDFYLTGGIALTGIAEYVKGISDIEGLHYFSFNVGLQTAF